MDTAKGDQTRTVVEEHQEATALLDGRRQAAAINRRQVILCEGGRINHKRMPKEPPTMSKKPTKPLLESTSFVMIAWISVTLSYFE